MTDRPGAPESGIRPDGGCALANLVADEDPIGTATRFDDLILLRHAGPWARIATSTPGLPSGLRAPIAAAIAGGRRVHALLVDAEAEPLPIAAREMLVCTHGERDGCCGRFGEAAYRYLRDHHAGSDLGVWRVSHFGGHRFAPTLLELPDGRCWGRLSADALAVLVQRSSPPLELMRHYRGWCAIPGPAQAAERDLFARHGWSWRHAEATVRLGEPDESDAVHALLRYRLPGRPLTERAATLGPVSSAAVPASCSAVAGPVRHYACDWHTPATVVRGRGDAPASD